MTWDRSHSQSERLASQAEAAKRAGDLAGAEVLYQQAAAAEAEAFGFLPAGKQRTRGVTAVSGVALWYKGRDYAAAERLAHAYLASAHLLPFAEARLRELLHVIWAAQCAIKMEEK